MPKKSSRQQAKIDGGGVLYHFLQNDLLKTDVWLFQMIVARLVASLGIWFRPSLYQQWPLLVPYAVRDPHSRGNKKLGIADQWGTPDDAGYFRDDNSLIKKLPGASSSAAPGSTPMTAAQSARASSPLTSGACLSLHLRISSWPRGTRSHTHSYQT